MNRPACCLTWLLLGIVGSALAVEPAAIKYKKIQLDDKFRSEGVAVGDFNHDGKLDIAAGFVYFAAPDWRMVPIEAEPKTFDPKGYSNSFCNFAADLNGDGWTDLIVVDFPGKQTWWYENPGKSGGPWTKHELTAVTNNESPAYLSILNKSQKSLLCGVNPDAKNPDGPERRMAFLTQESDPNKPWKIRTISAKAAPGTLKYAHGVGAGDVNGDGRIDVLCKNGWWEQPADAAQEEWTFHQANLGADCANMYVLDVNGDGKQDVVSTSAHQKGVWWHEQTADGWKTHLIDDSVSQTHSMWIADMNGDGVMDIVTGKRWWAHGPKGDIDPDKPAVVVWYECKRAADHTVTWEKHVIDDDSGVGTQFEIAEISGQGTGLDIAISNKKGTFVLLREK